MSELFIGLMSGTSADGIDAALVEFEGSRARLVAHHFLAYPQDLRSDIMALFVPGQDDMDTIGQLDTRLGHAFADATLALVAKAGCPSENIMAIGSHGQTIRHRPAFASRFTCQIGDANIIAERTGITTVADFRRRDMAAGGQGAPLVPAFHKAAFWQPGKRVAVVNIGGIANVTHITQEGHVRGFDCGPGNGLLDAWCERHTGRAFDDNGCWARQGRITHELLERLKEHVFFSAPPPKSTGKEEFTLQWLLGMLDAGCVAEDVAATLTELTAWSIADALGRLDHIDGDVYICGGGAFNAYLMERIAHQLGRLATTTAALGVAPQHVEAMAFAWMARETLNTRPGNVPEVTGATGLRVLGAIYSR